jgi:ribosomal subunit interface protein
MKINLKATNMELTEAINDYVVKKITNLGRLLQKIENGEEKILINFEVGQNTKHHKAGSIYHADCLININGQEFYSSEDKEDLYEAIDAVKDQLFMEISKNKDKKMTLFHRGARKIKNLLKGFGSFKK